MAEIRRLVLDVLKPHQPSITEYATETNTVEGVKGVNASLVEIDEEVENIKLTVEGEDINDNQIKEKIEGLGGSIHSVDEIACGKKTVEKVETPQDT